MSHEVVVVGGGIGGLTTAALLSARGVDVCLLERESEPGGCLRVVEKSGYRFEPGASLYSSWGPTGIHARIFTELPIAPPKVRAVSPGYTVRLPDKGEVQIGAQERFESVLREVFPECESAAVEFYDEIRPIARALRSITRATPDINSASWSGKVRALLPHGIDAIKMARSSSQTAAEHLRDSSERFRRFMDVQLQLIAQRPSDECAYLYACMALTLDEEGFFEIYGGARGLVDALTASIKASGGTVRCDAPVLRLAYNEAGTAIGVDLLTGERVEATRAIISNLTVWDTYGKLIGLDRNPPGTQARLKNLKGWGAYTLYLSIDEETAERLVSERVLVLTDWQHAQPFDPESAMFMFSVSPSWNTGAPEGKRAVTVCTFTEADRWFTYHEDETEHEQQDQATLESWWERIHAAMPELGSGIEVIDTATPRTFYDSTRRRLGMLCGLGQSLDVFGKNSFNHRTHYPNLYMVGDCTFPGQGVAAVSHSALIVADEIAPRTRSTQGDHIREI